MVEANPWLSSPHMGPHTVSVEPEARAEATEPRRPSGRQSGVPAPDLVDQLPTAEHRLEAPAWWVGVHGGAGESTLARLTSSWPAAGRAWPVITTPTNTATRVLLVARSNAGGLRAAQHAAAQWASYSAPEPVQVLGLVIVADAPGRLPRPLRELAALVSGGVPHTWFIPWVEAWRLGEPASLETAPGEVLKVLQAIGRLLPPADPTSTFTR